MSYRREMRNRGKEEASSTILECCMCGDYGLPDELFRCKICFFRFQHRYCSNLYPKAESYRVCNWCLIRKGRKMMDAPHNSSTSLSSANDSKARNEELQSKNRRKSNCGNDDDDGLNDVKVQRGSLQLHLQNPMKKKRSPEEEQPSSSTKGRNFKRIISKGCLEETLRRTKSEEIIPKTTTTRKQVFRGKVRRYKLLDEVSA